MLWNAAGPSAGAMVTCLGILKDELEGDLAEILAEFKNQPKQLISFLYKEAGTETNANYITAISAQLSQLDGEESKEGNESHVKVINYNGEALAESTVNVATGESQDAASKTQGTHPVPNSQVPQKGLSQSLPQKQEGTRRECNP